MVDEDIDVCTALFRELVSLFDEGWGSFTECRAVLFGVIVAPHFCLDARYSIFLFLEDFMAFC